MGGKGREGVRGPKRGRQSEGVGENTCVTKGKKGLRGGRQSERVGKRGKRASKGSGTSREEEGRTSVSEQRSNGDFFGRNTSKKATGWDEDL